MLNKIQKIIIATVLLCIYNFTVVAETLTVETVTEALAYSGEKATVTKLVVKGKIAGDDYSDSSEWSKFRTLNETFPNIEAVEIWTDQDIPDGSQNGGLFYDGNDGSHWLKHFSASNVKMIGRFSFCNCENLTTVNFSSATTVGDWAFRRCKNLTTVNFPLVETIEWYAFSDCSNLTTINFPSATTIEYYAFSNCSNLTTINFPLVQVIGDQAFAWCSNLTTINFPLVQVIGGWAFYACSSLTTVDFLLVTTIGNRSFAGCQSLTTVSFPLITMVGSHAFANCNSLISVSLGTGFETETEISFDSDVFIDDNNPPNGLTENIDLTLGEFVLPKPDLIARIWQKNYNVCALKDYVWRSITIYSSIYEAIKNLTVSIFPNPTVSDFTVSFDLEKSCNLQIILCDILGRELFRFYDGFAAAGNFTRTFSTENLAKGIYFLKISAAGNSTVEKIIVE